MGNFKRGGKSFGGRKRFGDKDGGRPAMHKAICGECGVNCEVPFRPTGERPVLCNNCFKTQGSGGGRRSNFGDRQMHSEEIMEQINLLNAKIDKLMEILTSKTSIEKIKKPKVKKEPLAI